MNDLLPLVSVSPRMFQVEFHQQVFDFKELFFCFWYKDEWTIPYARIITTFCLICNHNTGGE